MRFKEFKKLLRDVQIFNKGWRGYIYTGFWEGRKVAVKVARSPEKEYAIKKEAEILTLLKGLKNFPQILYSGEDFFVYQFIEGLPLQQLSLSPEEKVRIYRKVLDLVVLLDKMRINRDELQRLDKNLLVGADGEVYLLDFERGQPNATKPHNFTQFLQFLRKEGILSQEEAVRIGKLYRTNPEEACNEVKSLLDGALPTPP
ncbi:conserved hypothetical protein [Thermocrinis albus DSM 14484]|uniref:Serine/threonine protein kinase n=1 Tax=Thermocrinis albus (strain DSM 14484 / JCM 11386 / HI 11/12) TaxID=638303 RepID=D3SPC0_THEAH|nr:hypothetical protein [Thermocrinis albus]ADC89007.1 conserved hypothetical protein [Thermocrinis albus DSM 14484]